MNRVILVLKNGARRCMLMAQFRTLGIPYVEAPDLREAQKRLQREWTYSLICYDPHGLGIESCHNYSVVLAATSELRQKCGSPMLLIIDECVTEENEDAFARNIAPFRDILGACPPEGVVRVVNYWLQAESLA